MRNNIFRLVDAKACDDATSVYRVEFKEVCTVEDFIKHVLKTRPQEWGVISINGKLRVNYKRGKLLLETHSAYLKYCFILDIKEATAHGGWGLMNYHIITE